MKISNTFLLYSQYWIDGARELPYQLASLLCRIKDIVQSWFCTSDSAEELECDLADDCERAKKRILTLQRNLVTVQQFIASRPDLKEVFDENREKDAEYILQLEAPQSSDDESDSPKVTAPLRKLYDQEIYLQSACDELEHFIESHRGIKRCMRRHLKHLESAESVTQADRDMLALVALQRARKVVIIGSTDRDDRL